MGPAFEGCRQSGQVGQHEVGAVCEQRLVRSYVVLPVEPHDQVEAPPAPGFDTDEGVFHHGGPRRSRAEAGGGFEEEGGVGLSRQGQFGAVPTVHQGVEEGVETCGLQEEAGVLRGRHGRTREAHRPQPLERGADVLEDIYTEGP